MDFDFTGMIEVPNFFTPNGDNENDFWAPNNRDFFPNIEVVIYDRYGRVVAKLDNVSEWDGTYESKEVPTGDYWYVVNANDEEKQIAEESKLEVQTMFPDQEIVTPILAAATFWPIQGDESYHQDYYKNNPVRYKYYRWGCRRDQRVEEIWGDKVKHEM